MQKISIQSENKSFCLNISLEHITSEDEIKLNSMAIHVAAHHLLVLNENRVPYMPNLEIFLGSLENEINVKGIPFLISPLQTGYFVKLLTCTKGKIKEACQELNLSEAFIEILILAHENDFSVICMEEDSPKIEGFPTFNWLVRTGEDLAKRLSEDSFLDW